MLLFKGLINYLIIWKQITCENIIFLKHNKLFLINLKIKF